MRAGGAAWRTAIVLIGIASVTESQLHGQQRHLRVASQLDGVFPGGEGLFFAATSFFVDTSGVYRIESDVNDEATGRDAPQQQSSLYSDYLDPGDRAANLIANFDQSSGTSQYLSAGTIYTVVGASPYTAIVGGAFDVISISGGPGLVSLSGCTYVAQKDFFDGVVNDASVGLGSNFGGVCVYVLTRDRLGDTLVLTPQNRRTTNSVVYSLSTGGLSSAGIDRGTFDLSITATSHCSATGEGFYSMTIGGSTTALYIVKITSPLGNGVKEYRHASGAAPSSVYDPKALSCGIP